MIAICLLTVRTGRYALVKRAWLSIGTSARQMRVLTFALDEVAPVVLELKTGSIRPDEMVLVRELFTSVISMTFFNPALDKPQPLPPNSEWGSWDKIDQAPSQSDPCLDHWFAISCNEGTIYFRGFQIIFSQNCACLLAADGEVHTIRVIKDYFRDVRPVVVCKDWADSAVEKTTQGQFKSCAEAKATGMCDKAGPMCGVTCDTCPAAAEAGSSVDASVLFSFPNLEILTVYGPLQGPATPAKGPLKYQMPASLLLDHMQEMLIIDQNLEGPMPLVWQTKNMRLVSLFGC